MGKEKKQYIGVGPDGSPLKCDSNEEMYFTWWLYELKLNGCIISYSRSETIRLSDGISDTYIHEKPGKKTIKREVRNQTILDSKDYTPDFDIQWAPHAKGIFFHELFGDERTKKEYIMHGEPEYAHEENPSVYFSKVEVKPAFDYQNMTRLAKTNISWVFEAKGLIINLIIPTGKKGCLFDLTFTPRRYFMQDQDSTKTRKITKFKPKTFEEFIRNEYSQVNIVEF